MSRLDGWWRRRTVWLPTWRTWAVLVGILAVGFGLFLHWIHPWLAVNDPVPAEILVVEGWLGDDALAQAAREFRRGGYRVLVTTGIPLDRGNFLVGYSNYAHLAQATLVKLGVEPVRIRPAPAGRVIRHRTHESAVAFGQWLGTNEPPNVSINLLTSGTHARRSRFVYERVLRRKVGVISVPEGDYDPARWWASSQGVKCVIEEMIGCTYSWVQY